MSPKSSQQTIREKKKEVLHLLKEKKLNGILFLRNFLNM
jgi:hypothetical protein